MLRSIWGPGHHLSLHHQPSPLREPHGVELTDRKDQQRPKGNMSSDFFGALSKMAPKEWRRGSVMSKVRGLQHTPHSSRTSGAGLRMGWG